MKILIISKNGKSLGLAQHLGLEGHLVSMAILDSKYIAVGDGIVGKLAAASPVDMVSQSGADMVICDDGAIRVKEHLPDMPVLGGSKLSQIIESGNQYSGRIMCLAGIGIEDEDGIVVSVGAFWDGHEMVAPHVSWQYNIDQNYICRIDKDTRIYKQSLEQLTRFMAKADYTGYVRVKVALHDDKMNGLSIHVSNDIDLLQTLFELKKGYLGDFLYSVASGAAVEGDWHNGIAAGIAVRSPQKIKPSVIDGVVPANLKHIWFQSAIKDQEQHYAGVASVNPMLYVTAGGHSLVHCAYRIRNTLSNLEIKNAEYNDFIPESVFETIGDWL